MIGFERHRALGKVAELPGDPRGDVPLGLQRLDAVNVAGGLDVAPVGRENDAVGADEARCIGALEPCQPEDVDRIGDEEALGAEAVELGEETLDAVPAHRGVARNFQRLLVALGALCRGSGR